MLTKPEDSKKQPKTFAVTYPDGKQIQVKRPHPEQLEDIAILSQSIFERFYTVYNYSRNCLGDVLGDKTCWGYINQLAKLLPVVGEAETGIDLDAIADDYEQLGSIFLTESIDPETGEILKPEEGKSILPSKIAGLCGQHFFRVRAVEAIEKAEREKEADKTEPVVATP